MKRLHTILILSLFVTMAACGGGEEETSAEETTAAEVRTIEIIGIDQMKFVVAEDQDGITVGEQFGDEYQLEVIEAAPGEELRIILNARSQVPPVAMAHNFTLLESDTEVQQFIDQSASAADNEYISPAMEGRVIVTTSMLGGGESDTVQFNAPEEPGEYTFVCTFPGHFSGGMTGTLIVQ